MKFKKSKVSVSVGDLFIIDDIVLKGGKKWKLDNGKRIGKIIYLSDIFNEMMGFIFSKNTYLTIEEIYKEKNLNEIEFSPIVFYTSRKIIEDGNYQLINHNIKVTEQEIELTKRIVGNQIYQLDDNLKFANDDDYDCLYQQGYGGYAAHIMALNNLKEHIDWVYPKNHPIKNL